jgi:hypothetical protein
MCRSVVVCVEFFAITLMARENLQKVFQLADKHFFHVTRMTKILCLISGRGSQKWIQALKVPHLARNHGLLWHVCLSVKRPRCSSDAGHQHSSNHNCWCFGQREIVLGTHLWCRKAGKLCVNMQRHMPLDQAWRLSKEAHAPCLAKCFAWTHV